MAVVHYLTYKCSFGHSQIFYPMTSPRRRSPLTSQQYYRPGEHTLSTQCCLLAIDFDPPMPNKRQVVVSLTFDNVGCLFVYTTTALRMSTVMGSFLITSLDKALLRLSNVLVTREFSVGRKLLLNGPYS